MGISAEISYYAYLRSDGAPGLFLVLHQLRSIIERLLGLLQSLLRCGAEHSCHGIRIKRCMSYPDLLPRYRWMLWQHNTFFLELRMITLLSRVAPTLLSPANIYAPRKLEVSYPKQTSHEPHSSFAIVCLVNARNSLLTTLRVFLFGAWVKIHNPGDTAMGFETGTPKSG